MYTEDEAREKWCPHTREIGVDSVGGSANRYGGTPDTMCIGSACMAWRWEPEAALKQQQNRVPTGYCGLSGSPYMGGE